MSLHLVTGYKGAAHITAADAGALNAGTFGAGEYVLDAGNKFAASVLSSNTIQILDGDLMMQGRHITLKKDTYEEITIENGTVGMNRIDLIVVRYIKDAVSGVEDAQFAVIKGQETSGTPSVPEYTTGDILSGDCVLHEMPLYKIPLTELAVGTPEPLFKNSGLIGNGLLFRGWNPVASKSEDTPQKWRELGTGFWVIDLADIITGQPSQWGFLYNTVCLEEVAQTFIVQSSGETYRRNANGRGWYGNDWRSGEWTAFYDSSAPLFVSNTYTGDENESKFIDLGFTPSAVIVTRSDGVMHYQDESGNEFYCGGIALKNSPCTYWYNDADHPIITIENGGFRVYYKRVLSSVSIKVNNASNYHYIAYR